MLRLKELRLEHNKTQEDMAKALQISRQVYANYENRINEPSLETLANIADFFQCSIDYLIGREDDFGNVSIYPGGDLTSEEQKLIDAIRKTAPNRSAELLAMYADIPTYMQESIFAELKGMHLGYTVSKNQKFKEK